MLFELSVKRVKEDKKEEFLSLKKELLEMVGSETSILDKGEWKPFFTFSEEEIDLSDYVVSVTKWKSKDDIDRVKKLLSSNEIYNKIKDTVELKDYFLLETKDGEDFDLGSIKGKAVEFAVRVGKTDDVFGDLHEGLFTSLKNYDGYEIAREFKVYKLDEAGVPRLMSNTQAAFISWGSQELFQNATTGIFPSEEFNNFINNVDVISYYVATNK